MKHDEILHALQTRYTCKKYKKDAKIKDLDWQTIIESAHYAPTSLGLEPWKILQIDSPEIRQALFPNCWGGQRALEAAQYFIVLLTKTKQAMDFHGDYIKHMIFDIHHGDQASYQRRIERYSSFLDHDFDLSDDRKFFDWTSKQSYIVLANMLYTAALLNVAATPIEGFDRQKVNDTLVAFDLFDPNEYQVSVMAAFGVAEDTPSEKQRRPLDECIQVIR